MSRTIPYPIIALLSEHMADVETKATLDSQFMYADAPELTQDDTKHKKALAWLNLINRMSDNPLIVLGRLLEKYMEDPQAEEEFLSPFNSFTFGEENKTPNPKHEFKKKISSALAHAGLSYRQGGFISDGSLAPTRTLKDLILGRDLPAIHQEFDRALENVLTDPREAVSAASNILESVCKTYIEDEGLQMPPKRDILNVWKVIRDDLGFAPQQQQDEDLKQILQGLASIIGGVGALRTHASSAHGEGRWRYNLEPRHARLAINSAHTLASFIIESWDKKKLGQK